MPAMKAANNRFRKGLRTGIRAVLIGCGLSLFLWAGENSSRTSLIYGHDPNIKILMKGRAGNIELAASQTPAEGYTLTDYQKGSGFVEYNRQSQELLWRSKIQFTLNRLSRYIKRVAPFMQASIPKGAELDLVFDMANVGIGTFNFADLHINRIKVDVNYGDVDLVFPTPNQSIVRGVARFHLMAGDLEIYQLANLKAGKVKINGGVGELFVDFGPRLFQDMDVVIDHDIGYMELVIPKGTKALLSGTSRDLTRFHFQKVEKVWEPLVYHPNSPNLNIKLKGPLGDLVITWK